MDKWHVSKLDLIFAVIFLYRVNLDKVEKLESFTNITAH